MADARFFFVDIQYAQGYHCSQHRRDLMEQTKKAPSRLSAQRRVNRVGEKLMEDLYGKEWFMSIDIQNEIDISNQYTCPFVICSGAVGYEEACKRAKITNKNDILQRAGIIPYHGKGHLDPKLKQTWRRKEIAALNTYWTKLIIERRREYEHIHRL